MHKKYFGTDGIRGEVGRSLINPEFMLKLGWAFGRVLGQGQQSKVLIGKDTRVSGYMLESALEAGLSAAGVHTCLLGPVPTPAIAYLTRTLRATAGIVISASHNRFQDNGVKFFDANGAKLSDDIELAIEAELEASMDCVPSAELGKAERIDDARGRYIEFCKSTFPAQRSLNGLRIVIDCANGACYHTAPEVLHELGAQVITLGVSPDGYNINDQCGAVHTQALQEKVIAEQADLGIALDGDGDRLVMVDHRGERVDGDELLAIIAQGLRAEGQECPGVVGTVMSNIGLVEAIERMGMQFMRAAVGDRYVMECLHKKGWFLGGEASGHLVNLNVTSTGDGMVSALQVLKYLQRSGRSLHELKQIVKKRPQLLTSVAVTKQFDVAACPELMAAIAEVEAQLGDEGRVLIRASGTEPVVRVMVEASDHSQAQTALDHLVEKVQQAVNVGTTS